MLLIQTNMTNQEIAQLNSYVVISIIINILLFGGWIWLMALNWIRGESWIVWGIFLYALSYAIIVKKVSILQSLVIHPHHELIEYTYWFYVLQFCGTICFIAYSYIKKK